MTPPRSSLTPTDYSAGHLILRTSTVSGLGTCPTAANARLHKGHLSINTGDAIRLYGSTLVSLTEWGSTGGAVPNNIDLNRFPASGSIRYKRTMIVPRLVADLIRDGDAVIVVHGIDYNCNHVYDFKALGVSDLDKTLPGEATAPALCGPLRPARGTKIASVRGQTTFVASLKPDPAAAGRLPSATTSAAEAASPGWPGGKPTRRIHAALSSRRGMDDLIPSPRIVRAPSALPIRLVPGCLRGIGPSSP